jgi:hypothetical protein
MTQMCRVSSRQIAFALLAVVLLLAAWSLFSLASVTDATIEAMTPGDRSTRRWRLVAIQLLAVSVVAGVVAFDRVRRGDGRASLVAGGSALFAALGTWAAARMTGIASAFEAPIVFCVAVAGVAWWTWYRDLRSGDAARYVSGASAAVWLAATLQAGAMYFLVTLSEQRRWPEGPLRTILLATPQWIAAWRLGSAMRLSRWDAATATALGTGGIIALVLVSLVPVPYLGFLGPALLRTPWGLAFYAGLGAGSWLFLRAGAALRGGLDPPRRDRKIAILVGCLGVPVLVMLGHLLGGLLP